MKRLMMIGLAAMLATPGLAADAGPTGVWRNRHDSVHIRIAPCGPSLCGTVIWANAKAKADVAASGRTLIGSNLFRGMAPQDDGSWAGRVYVPDIGHTFSGRVRQNGPNTLTAKGCLIAGFFCKTSIWTRVS